MTSKYDLFLDEDSFHKARTDLSNKGAPFYGWGAIVAMNPKKFGKIDIVAYYLITACAVTIIITLYTLIQTKIRINSITVLNRQMGSV